MEGQRAGTEGSGRLSERPHRKPLLQPLGRAAAPGESRAWGGAVSPRFRRAGATGQKVKEAEKLPSWFPFPRSPVFLPS